MSGAHSAATRCSVSAARAIICTQAQRHVVGTEILPLSRARGRILASDLHAPEAFPSFPTARMDGYAVRLADFSTDNKPTTLHIVGHVGAGQTFASYASPQAAIRIMTGAPIPESFNAVVKLEDCTIVKGDGYVGSLVSCPPPQHIGQHISAPGSLVTAGQQLAPCNALITPAGIGLAATVGIVELEVYKRPRIALTSIGSELVDIDTTPRAGQIRNSNTSMLAALIEETGAELCVYPPLTDSLDEISTWLMTCATSDGIDMAITTGGTAHGDYDYIAAAIEQTGVLHYQQVDMVPAPTHLFGTVGTNMLAFGLPGVPGAALTAFEMMVRPALMHLMHHSSTLRPEVRATITHSYPHNSRPVTRPRYVRGYLERNDAGKLVVSLEDTGVLTPSVRWAHQASYNCITCITHQVHAGDEVMCTATNVNELEGWIG